MARRDFLAGAWPWRSLGYLLWTVPIMSIVAFPFAILALPWFGAIGLEQRMVNRPSAAVLLVLVFVGAGMLAAFGPLIALPLAKLEPGYTDEGLRAAVALRRSYPELAVVAFQPVRRTQLCGRTPRLRRRQVGRRRWHGGRPAGGTPTAQPTTRSAEHTVHSGA
jgi:hypothetical protein